MAFSPRIHLVPLATINLQKKFPKINLKILAGQRMELLSNLMKGNIDLFVSAIVPDDILFLEGADENTFQYLSLYKDTQYIVTRYDHPLQNKKDLRLTDTLNYNWILPEHEKTVRLFDLHEQFLNDLEIPKPKIIHNSVNFSLQVIKYSNYIVLHKKKMIETQKDGLLKILNVKGITMEPIYGITYLRNKPLRTSCQLIIEELSKVSNEMINQGLLKKI